MLCSCFPSVVESGVHITWVDNFSKSYAMQCPSLVNDAYTQCLWTGVAIHGYLGDPFDLSLACGHPGTVFNEVIPDGAFARLVAMFGELDGGNFQLFSDSLVNRLKVRRVPLKVQVNRRISREGYQRSIQSLDGLDNFHPKDVLGLNIGANAGLFKILKNMSDEHDALPESGKCIKVVVCDVDIYQRILKVDSKHLPSSCSFNS